MGIQGKLFTALVVLISIASLGLGCNEDEFQCDNGLGCIIKSLKCNGKNDCRDRSDESPGWLFNWILAPKRAAVLAQKLK